jgi:hypothetical protein
VGERGWWKRGKRQGLTATRLLPNQFSPYNSFFFSGYGFDSYLQQRPLFRPPRGPSPRQVAPTRGSNQGANVRSGQNHHEANNQGEKIPNPRVAEIQAGQNVEGVLS